MKFLGMLAWVMAYGLLYLFVFDFEPLVIIMLAQILFGVIDLRKA